VKLVDHIKFDHGYTSSSPAVINVSITIHFEVWFFRKRLSQYHNKISEYSAVVRDHTRVWMPWTQSFLAIYNGFTSTPSRGFGCTESKFDSCPEGLFSM
jgi:hypothetical protein